MPEISVRFLINTFSVLGALFAFWKGGPAERATAAVVMLNVLIGYTGAFLAPQLDNMIRLVNDGLTALIILAITLRYGALWMGGVMLFFAAQFSMHSYYIVTGRETGYLYALINNINFSGIIWCLIIGTAVAWRRRIRSRRARAAEA
jgi:cbb3-type cytochrome oxidase subunit 3